MFRTGDRRAAQLGKLFHVGFDEKRTVLQRAAQRLARHIDHELRPAFICKRRQPVERVRQVFRRVAAEHQCIAVGQAGKPLYKRVQRLFGEIGAFAVEGRLVFTLELDVDARLSGRQADKIRRTAVCTQKRQKHLAAFSRHKSERPRRCAEARENQRHIHALAAGKHPLARGAVYLSKPRGFCQAHKIVDVGV